MWNTAMPFQSLATLKKVGHITPSSNVALEPITVLLNTTLSDRLSHHFARVKVTHVTPDRSAVDQFAHDKMLAAAELLADARMDAIVWNGTSSSWSGVGLEHDRELCRRITERLRVPATTTSLAFEDAYRRLGVRRIGLAVPYTRVITDQVISFYHNEGYQVVSEAHLEQTTNDEITGNSFDDIKDLLRRADSPEADCIAVVCTNLAATPLIEEMEEELGKPIVDSIAVTFWSSCQLVGINPALAGWGRLLNGGVSARHDRTRRPA